MFADAGSSAFPGERAEQGGDPGFLPGRGEGAAAAARQTGAAAAGEDEAVVGVGQKASGAVLWGEISGEEADVVGGAAERTAGAGRAQVTEHAGQVAVLRYCAPVAAAGARKTAASGGRYRRVYWEVEAAVIQGTWKHKRGVSVRLENRLDKHCG